MRRLLFFLLTFPSLICCAASVYDSPEFKEKTQRSKRTSKEWIRFGRVIEKKYPVVFLNNGWSEPFPIDDYLLSLMFASWKPIQINEARELAVSIHSQLWQWMSADSDFEKRFESVSKMKINPHQLPWGSEYVAFRITVWSLDYERYPSPSVSQILVYHNIIEYAYVDPETQGLLPPIRETIEEAKAKLAD